MASASEDGPVVALYFFVAKFSLLPKLETSGTILPILVDSEISAPQICSVVVLSAPNMKYIGEKRK